VLRILRGSDVADRSLISVSASRFGIREGVVSTRFPPEPVSVAGGDGAGSRSADSGRRSRRRVSGRDSLECRSDEWGRIRLSQVETTVHLPPDSRLVKPTIYTLS